MALELITNLKLIDGTARVTIPTTTELPLGYMCFGVINGRASIWGNYDNTVHDLIDEGETKISIVQVTGSSTTAVMSQDATTKAINEASSNITDSLGSAASKNVGTSAGNVPELDINGKLPESTIPSLAITDVFVVDSESAMLALNDAKTGDVAVRTDISTSFILSAIPASTLSNWIEFLANPDHPVTSVNGKTGNVTLTGADISTTFSVATSRTNISSGETLATSLGKIAKYFSDLKGLAYKDTITATSDISGIVPNANLPTASSSALGIAKFGNGLNVSNGTVTAKAGTGIIVDSTGINADVTLKIATI